MQMKADSVFGVLEGALRNIEISLTYQVVDVTIMNARKNPLE